MAYRLLFRLVLERLDPELAHRLAAGALRVAASAPVARPVLRRVAGPRDPRLEVRALGRTFPGPLGAAAGVDKDAGWYEALGALGFGFVEVGTVTVAPQPGNPRPRVARLPRDRALWNRMGFPNPGADAVARRLRERTGGVPVGVNVGRSRATPPRRAADDYRALVRRLGPLADYLVVNVSSPNTPGVTALQAAAALEPLLTAVREELRQVGERAPLLLKIGPDLGGGELDSVADLAVRVGLDGIVAVNTTVDRTGVEQAGELPPEAEGGGISGAPLKSRALTVLERLYDRVGDRLVLISVGGIETPDDAWRRILAGATLVQAYTGFIYGGPAWPRRVNRSLAHRVSEAGGATIQDLVGTACGGRRPTPPLDARGQPASSTGV